MKTKTYFVSEDEIESNCSFYKTLGEVRSDNDDIFSDDSVIIELVEVRRYKARKPKIEVMEIKPKK